MAACRIAASAEVAAASTGSGCAGVGGGGAGAAGGGGTSSGRAGAAGGGGTGSGCTGAAGGRGTGSGCAVSCLRETRGRSCMCMQNRADGGRGSIGAGDRGPKDWPSAGHWSEDPPAPGGGGAGMSTFSSISGPGASQRDHDGAPTGQEVSERPQPRPRGGNRGLALTGLDALARLHLRLHGSGPARRGVAPAAAWTVADALSVAGVAAGAAWAPRIDAAARSLQPARVRHHPADVLAFTEVAAAWLAKARAVLAERHRRRRARRAGGAGQSSVLPSPALPSVDAFRGVAAPPVVAPTPPEVGAPAGHPGSQASRARYPPSPSRPSPAGDGVGWGAVDHLSDVDMVHMPVEMSMETAVPIDFQEAWAEAQRCVNERVVAAMEADDPVVLDRALKWKYMLPQLLLRAASRGGRRRLQALAWRFRAFAERRMTELVRSWDDARTEAFYAGHARQRRTDADLLRRCSHPIPDAAYDIPVDEAALTVDMRVPYQQLKQHVAAGPSGRRNEYLRCLVGEYAPASGPAAVRAMSEVASMYLQGRLPGWFNRLFASARLVAPVKKLGEGRAPDVRPVAVGEAERRASERAVVDNMKEAYVSVLAPSQLGVGIPSGDSVLIHGVRLIAEKLGPRAVIVHTDLRNAYNEAWRRTIIQRHIDCSPLHPVIPALLASLSTDSYLVVDDRSAPLRSEDGVQHGAPLATTSFCVAIHPEVHQCDTTLEVNDGAARFNADDGFSVGLPEHVWPALHAFRTSIKASAGLEVRFDKMQAYNADMEAARREAPADIEWPGLDGHHGIAVLNVPLGSPEYVQAYMRGKAEELREEAFAEAVDATILAAVERVLGVSFDPSTYGTDTNPVVTDFLAELLHDPDPMAAEVATLSEDAVAMARCRLDLPTRLKGAGIRRMATVRDAAFIGCMNAILPRERILFNQLDAVSGMWTVAIPTARTTMTPHELRETLTGVYITTLSHIDAFRDHCVHDPGIAVRREVDDLSQQAVPLGNTVPRDELKDLVPDAELSLPASNVVTGSYDPRSLKSTLMDFKTMRYGVKYTSVPLATAVDRFERSLLGDIQRGLAARDAA
eukprot:jgi/Tetstr1/433787/TSEL_002413.t1